MDKIILKFRNKGSFNVHVANSPEEQADGLLKFESLKDKEGMLFPFEKTKKAVFHCTDMLFPISIFSLKKHGDGYQVVDFNDNCEPDTGESFQFAEADAVLELPAYTAKKHGIVKGTFCKMIIENKKAQSPKQAARKFMAQLSERTYSAGTEVCIGGLPYKIKGIEGSSYLLDCQDMDAMFRVDHRKFQDMIDKGVYVIHEVEEDYGDPTSQVKYMLESLTDVIKDAEMEYNSDTLHRSEGDLDDFWRPNPRDIYNRKMNTKDDYKVIADAQQVVQKVEGQLKTAGHLDEFVMKSARIDGLDNMGRAISGIFTISAKIYDRKRRYARTVTIPIIFGEQGAIYPEYMEDSVGRQFSVDESGVKRAMGMGYQEHEDYDVSAPTVSPRVRMTEF